MGIEHLLSAVSGLIVFASANVDVLRRKGDDVHVSRREWNDDVMVFNTGVLSIFQCLTF